MLITDNWLYWTTKRWLRLFTEIITHMEWKLLCLNDFPSHLCVVRVRNLFFKKHVLTLMQYNNGFHWPRAGYDILHCKKKRVAHKCKARKCKKKSAKFDILNQSIIKKETKQSDLLSSFLTRVYVYWPRPIDIRYGRRVKESVHMRIFVQTLSSMKPCVWNFGTVYF